MKRCTLLALLLLAGLSTAVVADDLLRYVISDFPLGVGFDVGDDFWAHHRLVLRDIADTLCADTSLRLEITGWADANRYRSVPHTPANAGLSVSRYDVAKRIMTDDFGVPAWQILPTNTSESTEKGPQWRKVEFRVVHSVDCPKQDLSPILEQIAALKDRPPIQVTENRCYPNFSEVWVAVGAAYTPMERFVPFVQAQWGNDRLRIFGEAGHSIYTLDQRFGNEELEVSYRYVSGGVMWRPLLYGRLDVVLGWQRNETYSSYYGKYARKLEGPVIGLRMCYGHFALTGLWAPSEDQMRNRERAEWDYNRVQVSASAFTSILGGGK